eukprot:8256499-Pyramimonas_sp.AAC.1
MASVPERMLARLDLSPQLTSAWDEIGLAGGGLDRCNFRLLPGGGVVKLGLEGREVLFEGLDALVGGIRQDALRRWGRRFGQRGHGRVGRLVRAIQPGRRGRRGGA